MIASEIVQASLREGNLIPVGTSPTAAQLSEGLGRLNTFLRALFGNEIGEPLFPWLVPPPQQTSPVAARWPYPPYAVGTAITPEVWANPPGNVRLIVGTTQAETVYLQHQPNPGARVGYANVNAAGILTIDGNGSLIEGEASIDIDPISTTQRLWFFRDDLATWVSIVDLVAADDSPLPMEFDDLLICGLCIRMSSRYGLDPRSGTVATYQDQRKKLQARYRQPTPTLGGGRQIPNSWQAWGNNDGYANFGDVL